MDNNYLRLQPAFIPRFLDMGPPAPSGLPCNWKIICITGLFALKIVPEGAAPYKETLAA